MKSDKRQEHVNRRYRTRLALTNMDYRDGEPLKALQLLLSVFDTSLSFASRLANQHELSKETMKHLEIQLQTIYKALEMATYHTGLSLIEAEHAEHPLKLLWDQWAKQKEKVTEMAEWFLQK